MKRRNVKGVAIVEFAFCMVVMIPLLLGTIGFGFRLIQQMQVTQLARDAGRMYARGLDFSQAGNKTTIATLGSDLGLQTTDAGKTVLILTTVTYIDKGMCQSDGYAVDVSGEPIGCPNYKNWVFAQRLTVGKISIHTSTLGSPLTSGPDAPLVDGTTGKISPHDQVSKKGDVATFDASGNPFISMDAHGNSLGILNTLPSGQVLYITEAASVGFTLMPYDAGGLMYAFNVF